MNIDNGDNKNNTKENNQNIELIQGINISESSEKKETNDNQEILLENPSNSIEEKESTENNLKENENTQPKFSTILKHSSKLFVKSYSVRIIYSLLIHLRNKEKRATGLKGLVGSIFNIENLRTSAMIGSLPLFFDIIKKIIFKIFKYFNKENKSDLITFISGFLSSYLSICFEEKSKLVNFIILSITVRAIHSWLVVKTKDTDRFDGRFWNLFKFLIAANLMFFTNFLNPGFEPITTLFDGYSNYKDLNEKAQMTKSRDIFRIV